MILTGPAIAAAIARGDIRVDPFDPAQIQPNGIDYHLGTELIHVRDDRLDTRHPPRGERIVIGPEGVVLEPGELYLGLTREAVEAKHHAQWLFGDRSLGSLGVFTQVSAPLGHTGSKIRWTLELVAVRAVRLYSGMKAGKICFIETSGATTPYGGKYVQDAISLSKLAQELDP